MEKQMKDGESNTISSKEKIYIILKILWTAGMIDDQWQMKIDVDFFQIFLRSIDIKVHNENRYYRIKE